VQEEKSDISAIYFYAILGGLIQLSMPLGIQTIIGFVLGGSMSASLIVLISALVLGVMLSGMMQINQMKIIEKIQQKIYVRFSYAFADRIPKLDMKHVDGFYLPELVNRFFETVSLQKGISKLLLDFPVATIQIFFGLLLLSFYHPFFILFSLLLVFILWLILYVTGNKGLDSSLTESRHKYSLAGWFEEMARLNKSFRFSAASGMHLKKANHKTIEYLNARTSHFQVLLLQYRTLLAFKVAITAAMLIFGVILLLNQQINIGQFVAAELIILIVISAVEKIITNLDSVYDVLTAVEKLGKLTDKPVEICGSYKVQEGIPLSVEAHHLTFGYDAQKPVIKDLSFQVQSGGKVCITGEDGAGKSTLLKLLTGVYSGFSGALLVNKIPLHNYDLTVLRDRTGILFPQENIFHGTLWENITMGKADIDKEYVAMLCQQSGLQNFIATLPLGFDTELEPTGKRLPRNVIQKILLVRAMAHKPRLLIMEEPWQGIEEQYKRNIQQILLNAVDTTVIIATSDTAFASQCQQAIQLGYSKN
jgi:ABC-type bacteriocin/lantibiotic exporter with double-glycine peptidase domain